MMAKYINPYTDFGFEKIFGEEASKPHLIEQAFEKASLANLGQSDLDKYEMNLKVYRDYKNTIDTAFDEGKIEGKIEGRTEGRTKGRMEGRMEGRIETAKQLRVLGVDISIIAKSTGLSEDDIGKLI